MKNILLFITASIFLIFPSVNFAQAPVLGTAADYVIFTTVGAVGNTGISQLTGNIGTNGGAITGFGNVNGAMHPPSGSTIITANDVQAANLQLNGTIPNFVPSTLLGNGHTLLAGVYSQAANTSLNLNLYLDGKGDTNAVFIFQLGATFSANTNSQIVLLNGA